MISPVCIAVLAAVEVSLADLEDTIEIAMAMSAASLRYEPTVRPHLLEYLRYAAVRIQERAAVAEVSNADCTRLTEDARALCREIGAASGGVAHGIRTAFNHAVATAAETAS